MPEGQVLEFSRLSKRFGSVHAVSDLTARVEPGAVTGFLGPNGAGKTTTLRMLLGLVRPSFGTATIGGVPYAKLKKPLQTVGAVLEASSFHPGRSGANHLKIYAQAAGLSRARIDETLGLVGLADAAGRKVGGYSLGMRQRLGLAYALLGDPGVLVLDEPANGLDPEGIKWLRGFLQQLAREGRTVLVSSHLLTEVQQTADAVLILADGRRVFNGGISDLVDPAEQVTIVDSGDRAGLVAALRDAGIASEVLRSGVTVRAADPADVGRAAAAAGIPLTALQRRGPALEEVFLDLVSGVRVHPSADAAYDDRDTSVDAPPAGVGAAEAVAAAAAEPAEPGAAAEPAEPGAPAEPAEPAETVDAPAADDSAISAAVVVAPVVVAAAETPDEETEFDAPAPGPEAEQDAEQERDGEQRAEPEARPAFAVAATGVIDVVPGRSADSAAFAHPAALVDEDAPDAQPASAPEGAVDSDEARAAEPGDDQIDEPGTEGPEDVRTADDRADDVEDLDDEELEDDDVSEDVESAYVTHSAHAGEDERTESDLAADAFFASFDRGGPSGDPEESGTDSADSPDSSAEEPEDHEEPGEPAEQDEPAEQESQQDSPEDSLHNDHPEDSDHPDEARRHEEGAER